MKKKYIKILILILVLIVTYFYFQYKKLMQYTFKIKKIKIENWNLQNFKANINLDIYNPSDFSVKLIQTDLKIFINGILINDVKNNQETTILKKSNFNYNLKINTDLTKILKGTAVVLALSDFEKINITFKGFIVLEKFNIKIKVPIDYTNTLKYLIS